MTVHKKLHNWWIRNYNFDRKHYLPTSRKWNLFTILKSWEITKRQREREKETEKRKIVILFLKSGYMQI